MFDPAIAEYSDPALMEWITRHESYGNGRSSSECRRGCCWTPFGHSSVVDASARCVCHARVEVTV